MRYFYLLIFVLVSCVGNVFAQDNYARLEARAARFVQFQEWNSANAMYMLMIDQLPNVPKTYSRAIVTSGLLSDDKTQVGLLEMTQKQGISLDSIFAEVNKFAYEIGESQEYEQFLKLVKQRQPWIGRNINMRLLRFYNFRNDAPNMVAVGKELLAATPQDVNYLLTVGRGYMLQGDYENAVKEYNKVLAVEPHNYDALLALGNYYYVEWKNAEGTRSQFASVRDLALKYLEQANTLRPTPFVSTVIGVLEGNKH